MKSIYVFDFDGTLTYKDTLLEFIKYSKGTFRFIFGFLLFSPLLVLMKLHLYDNGKAKQQLFAFYFQGMSLTTFDTLCHDFARDKHVLFRPQAFQYLQSIKKQADQILVISASIDNWVRPFFSTIFSAEESFQVLGTKLEVRDGKLTGRFLTPNCYGQEKVNRLKQVLNEPRQAYSIKAFGDSRGDKELLEYADQGHYKPFR
ncbi:HAD family hydrolase [Segatella bryantii]|jgi:HAD superfamily hydrolase (TIGR01490 family)|uniref:HAD family hydrolase n=1 Tax=Segatella bryantii TaxID=77095 RepID=UPI0009441422|nr:HAD family hydrolase [Segatella bryantii]